VRVDAGHSDDGSVQFVTQVEYDLPQRRVARLGANDLHAVTSFQSTPITETMTTRAQRALV